jgi:hypothetical protein
MHRLLVGKSEGKIPLENQDVGGWIILRRILESYDGMVLTGLSWLRTGTSGELL